MEVRMMEVGVVASEEVMTGVRVVGVVTVGVGSESGGGD